MGGHENTVSSGQRRNRRFRDLLVRAEYAFGRSDSFRERLNAIRPTFTFLYDYFTTISRGG